VWAATALASQSLSKTNAGENCGRSGTHVNYFVSACHRWVAMQQVQPLSGLSTTLVQQLLLEGTCVQTEAQSAAWSSASTMTAQSIEACANSQKTSAPAMSGRQRQLLMRAPAVGQFRMSPALP
jgi:hypothetical protein